MSLETCQRAKDVTLETATHKELFSGVLSFILSVHENHLKILRVFLRGGDLIKEKDFHYQFHL